MMSWTKRKVLNTSIAWVLSLLLMLTMFSIFMAPAHAAPITNITDLQTEIAGGGTVTLDQSISDTVALTADGNGLLVSQNVTIDLAGQTWDLSITGPFGGNGISIAPGKTLTITDTGTPKGKLTIVNSTSGIVANYGAGIRVPDTATLIIDEAVVDIDNTSTVSVAIGGGETEDAGSITLKNSSITTKTNTLVPANIGSKAPSTLPAGTITIDGGTINAAGNIGKTNSANADEVIIKGGNVKQKMPVAVTPTDGGGTSLYPVDVTVLDGTGANAPDTSIFVDGALTEIAKTFSVASGLTGAMIYLPAVPATLSAGAAGNTPVPVTVASPGPTSVTVYAVQAVTAADIKILGSGSGWTTSASPTWTGMSGENVTMNASVSGATGTFDYQWYKGTTATGTSATTGAFTFSPVKASDNGQYYCEVTQKVGGVTISTVKSTDFATIVATDTPPSITTDLPATFTYAANDTPTLSIVATGSQTLTYAWDYQASGSGVWTSLAGTLPSYSITTPLTAMHIGDQYRVIVANAYGTMSSTVLTINVAVPPTVTIPGTQSQVAVDGQSTTLPFTATGTGGTGTLTYKWYTSTGSATAGPWAPVTTGTGGTTANYTPLADIAKSTEYFMVEVTDANGLKASATGLAGLTLTVTPRPLTISQQPTNQTAPLGSLIAFSVTPAGGTPSYSYVWASGSSATGPFTPIVGATGATYTFTSTASDSGVWYQCTVTDSTSGTPMTATSSAVQYIVGALPTPTPGGGGSGGSGSGGSGSSGSGSYIVIPTQMPTTTTRPSNGGMNTVGERAPTSNRGVDITKTNTNSTSLSSNGSSKYTASVANTYDGLFTLKVNDVAQAATVKSTKNTVIVSHDNVKSGDKHSLRISANNSINKPVRFAVGDTHVEVAPEMFKDKNCSIDVSDVTSGKAFQAINEDKKIFGPKQVALTKNTKATLYFKLDKKYSKNNLVVSKYDTAKDKYVAVNNKNVSIVKIGKEYFVRLKGATAGTYVIDKK